MFYELEVFPSSAVNPWLDNIVYTIYTLTSPLQSFRTLTNEGPFNESKIHPSIPLYLFLVWCRCTHMIEINPVSLYAKIGTMQPLNGIQKVYNNLTSQRFRENYFLPFNTIYNSSTCRFERAIIMINYNHTFKKTHISRH